MIQPEPDLRLRVTWRTIAITAAVLGALWLYDVYVLRTTHLVPRWRTEPALTPLYAFAAPIWTSGGFVFVAAAILFVLRGPGLADPARVTRARFLAALVAWACVLPFTLFLVRLSPGDLGNLPAIYGYVDLAQDAALVGDPLTFLREYVQRMPGLSLHGQHYPPGPALFVHAWQQVFGTAPIVTGIVVLATFAVAMVGAYMALREIAGERAGRQGALLLLAVPSLIDHACTTLDVLFMAGAAWTWWCALLAFQPAARARVSVLLGVLLYACTLLSFSAFPLGLAVLFLGLVRGRAMLVRLLVVGASYAAAAGLFFAVTGFAMWECLHEARTHAEVFMSWRIEGTARATWAYRSYGNLAAFLIGGGVALAAAFAVRLFARRSGSETPRPSGWHGLRADGWTIVALLALSVMTLAPIYYMETERIWLFAYPWVAASAVTRGGFDTPTMRRLCLAGLGQALAMEALLFTFW